MSWLNEGLSPAILSHLTGQIKNFTQEVLSDGIINEIDDRSKNLEKANEECNQLKELMNSKDALISVLRKQNNELQRAVIELRTETDDSLNDGQNLAIKSEDEEDFFWDPPSASRSRDAKIQTKLLQEQLDLATLRIRELELDLDRFKKLNSSNVKDDANFNEEGPSLKTGTLRVKQDVMNSVIQMDEKLLALESGNNQLSIDDEDKISNLEEQNYVHYDKDKIKINCIQDQENKLRLRIEELEVENRNLSINIEELDKQNAESIEHVLSIKEEIQKKHQSLQNAYEYLYVEHNQALSQIENLNQQQKQQQQLVELQKLFVKETSDSSVQTFTYSKVNKETEIYLNFEDKETEVNLQIDEKLDAETEIEKIKNILKDVPFEASCDNKNESILVNLAKQFVNLKLKYEILECKLAEQSSELIQNQELRISLQTNCENMEKKMKLLLMEIDNSTTLSSKLKKKEELISSLEKKVVNMQENNHTLYQDYSDIYWELQSMNTMHEESINEELSKSEAEPTINKVQNLSETKQVNLYENKALGFTIDILKNQLLESSEIINIMENIKTEIISANQQIDEIPQQSTLINVNEEKIDSNMNRMKEIKDILLVLTDLYKKIDHNIIRRKHFDDKCQKLIADVEESQHNIIFNKNDDTINKTLKYMDNYVSNLENENKLLKKKILQIDHLRNENEKSKEKMEKLYEQQKLQEAENNLQKELTIKYQTELENLKTFKDENHHLKIELDKLLVEKIDVEVNTDDSTIQNLSNELLSNKEYSQLIAQLSEKSNEIKNLKIAIARDKESALMAKETVENLSQLISSKDSEIVKVNSSYDILKNERDKLIKLVQEKHDENVQYHSEIERLTQLLEEKTNNLRRVIDEIDDKFEILQKKEAQLLWTQNELQVVKQRLQNIEEASNYEECCGIAEHTLLSNQVSSLEERNKVMEAAIIQDQSNIRYLQEQLTDSQSKEATALKEVDRLRNHLLEIEANCTEEALQSEEIQRTLEARLKQVEQKLNNSSTLYTSASIRANQQVETLQQQLALIVQQRDDLQNKISSADDKVLSYSASLTNLQLVLEQFQRDKDKDIQIATEKLHTQLKDSFQKHDDLTNEITNLRGQLAEAKECLQAASRLTEQLERKSERIEQLNQEVSRLTELVSTADHRIEKANKSGEGKVDRSLVKNLLLGYISSPSNDKISVLRVFANVLDFNDTERETCSLNGSAVKNSWFSSVINSSSTSSKIQEASLSSAFIKFLENESQPKPQLPALPISNSSISRPSHSRQHSSSSTQSTLLLSNVTLPSFPDFVPSRNTGSILKEVLKDS